MSILDDPAATARRLLGRAGMEGRYAATLLQARGPGIATIPPHRLIRVLRDLEAYGPVGAAVTLAAAGQGGRVAIRDERGDLTFADLDAQVNALANALHASRPRGFRAGDGLGILARNHRGLYVAILAGAKLGARTLLLNTDFSGPQLADVCRRENVAVLVHDEEFREVAATYDPPLGRVLAWSDNLSDNLSDNPPDNPAETTLDAIVAGGRTGSPPRPAGKQRIVLLTSGTTGTPKGAPRDMKLSLAIPGGYLSKIPLRSGRTVLLAAPGFHAWGLLSSMLALGLGNTLVMHRKFDPTVVLDELESYRCDALVTVPVLLSRLLKDPDTIRGRDLSALRVVAVSGSALAPDLAARASDLLGDVLYNLYGSTEVAFATIATPADLRAAPGTVGRPPYGTVVKLLDADGAEVPRGQSGRIFVGSTIQFEGYTGGGSKQVVDGLMSTGDLGHVDGHGRLFVDGRDDDMIVSGGENVFPREVEELLVTHDGVTEAAVIGVDDAEFGKRLRAYVVREPGGGGLDEEAVKAYVRENLARYKVPREVVFLDALPRNPAGKVVRRELPEP